MVFVTDGAPNRNSNNSQTTTAAALTAAIPAATTVKGQLTHIFVVGVGAATSSTNIGNIQAISGGNRFPNPHGEFKTADYTLVDNFADLAARLKTIVTELCASQLIITKEVSDPHGGWTAKEGWRFTATLRPSPGHTWVEPAGFGTDDSATQITDARVARFEGKLESSVHTATLGVTHEVLEPGFHFVLAQCTTVGGGDEPTRESTTEIPGARLAADQFRTCLVWNRSPSGGGGGTSPECTECGDVAALPDLKVHKGDAGAGAGRGSRADHAHRAQRRTGNSTRRPRARDPSRWRPHRRGVGPWLDSRRRHRRLAYRDPCARGDANGPRHHARHSNRVALEHRG